MGLFGVNSRSKTTDAVASRGAKWLRSKYSGFFLGVISFTESVFAPIIIDPFLIAAIMAQPAKWKRFIVISISASVFGGIFGYVLGALFFDTLGVKLIEFYSLGKAFESISNSINEDGFVFVLIGAFTPIPYKIVAIASGLLQLNFMTFLVASIVGRILRLGLIGLAAHVVGPHALPIIRRNLYTIAAISGVILVGYIIFKLVS